MDDVSENRNSSQISVFQKSSNRKSFSSWLAVFGALYFLLFAFDYWPIKSTFGWSSGRNSIFGDLSMALRMMECSKEYGTSIYTFSNPNGCSGYTYGYLMALLIAFLGIGPSVSVFLGYIFIGVILLNSVIFIWLASQKLQLRKPYLILLVFSPPFWLAAAAPNFDSLVIMLLSIASFMEINTKHLSSLILVALSSLVKFFTLPLLILLCLKLVGGARYSLKQKFLALLLTFLVIISNLHDISLVDWSNPNYRMAAGIFFVFGISSPANWIQVISKQFFHHEFIYSPVESRFIGVLCVLGLIGVSGIVVRRYLLTLPRTNDSFDFGIRSRNFSQTLFLFFGVPFLTVFFQGQNYDSKLIFLSYCTIFLLDCFNFNSKKIKRSVMLVSLFSMWFSCFWPKSLPESIFNIVQILGDLSIFTSTSIILMCSILVILREAQDQKFIASRFNFKVST